MKLLNFIFFLVVFNFTCESQTMRVLSVTHNREPNIDGAGYTLDAAFTMTPGARPKLLSSTNFGTGGTYAKSVVIVDSFATSNSLTQIGNFPYSDIFFFGTFDKSDANLIQFTNEEIDSLYNWSTKGGKLIICGSSSPTGYNPTVLDSKWGFQISELTSGFFVANSVGLTTDIYNGPFGSIINANQAGGAQGYFSSLPTNISVLATDGNNNPTLVLDCATLDLILADVDGYTSNPGFITSGSSVTNDQDKFWVNTFVFMDKLQGLPTISVSETNLNVANIYNSYQWYKDDVAINGSTSNSIAVNEDGQYYVKVTVNGGCEVKSNTIIADSTLSIQNNSLLNSILKIYPNPSNSTFIIQLPDLHSFSLSIIDITGRTVYTNKNATGTITIDCSNFNAGVYFVKAINEKTVLTDKLIKQ
jgi:hypothetical protein